MDIRSGAHVIGSTLETALQRNTGCLIGRNGTIELETILYTQNSPTKEIPASIAKRMELHAGVWPSTQSSLHEWVQQMVEAIPLCDVLVAGWYAPLEAPEKRLLAKLGYTNPKIPLRSLEPYYVPPEDRWTRFLKGQRVAIVSSFADTITKQLENREEIWPLATESLLPSTTEWIPIRTGYAPVLAQGVAEWPSGIHSWKTAIQSLVDQILESKARIVLIGCGGLGMVLGGELKRRGLIAVVLGGAIQVLFGIKGMRWQTHSVISQLWNDAWVWPSVQETPRGSLQIEGACYWNKIEAVDI